MEDVRIGRKTQSGEGRALVENASVRLLVESNVKRIALTIGPPVTQNIRLSLRPNAAVGEGILFKTTDPPLQCHLLHGEGWVQGPIFASKVAAGGDETLSYFESVLTEEAP